MDTEQLQRSLQKCANTKIPQNINSKKVQQNKQKQPIKRAKSTASITPRGTKDSVGDAASSKGRTLKRSTSSASSTPRSSMGGEDDSPLNSARMNLVSLKIEGDETVKGDHEIYRNVPQLRDERQELLRKIAVLDGRVEGMFRMKGIYQRFCSAMQNFSAAIFKLDRNNQGVPYVTNVKNLVLKMYEEFNSTEVKSEIARMQIQQVPFLEDLMTQFANFHQLCESILVTHINYHVTFLEDFHLVAGKIRGIMKTIITLMYDDAENAENVDDNIIGDKEIEEASAKVYTMFSARR